MSATGHSPLFRRLSLRSRASTKNKRVARDDGWSQILFEISTLGDLRDLHFTIYIRDGVSVWHWTKIAKLTAFIDILGCDLDTVHWWR